MQTLLTLATKESNKRTGATQQWDNRRNTGQQGKQQQHGATEQNG